MFWTLTLPYLAAAAVLTAAVYRALIVREEAAIAEADEAGAEVVELVIVRDPSTQARDRWVWDATEDLA